MPRGDGTGPLGAGPMTGRGAGFCAGGTPFSNGVGGFLGTGTARGWGYALAGLALTGFLRHFQRRSLPERRPDFRSQEIDRLKKEISRLETAIDEMKKAE